jgi:putative ABC transport system permease protein
MSFVTRVSGDPGTRLRALVAKVRDLDPVVPQFDATTMADRATLSLAPASGGATALGIVGVLALVLTSLGLYGIIAQTVSRRTYEIGVRRGARGAGSRRRVARGRPGDRARACRYRPRTGRGIWGACAC